MNAAMAKLGKSSWSAFGWSGLATVGVLLSACGPSYPFESAELVGSWKSPSCEVGTGADGSSFYYTRNFTLTESSWTIDFVLFGDDACSYKLSTATIAGAFELLEVVEALPGTRQGNFERETLTLVAHDETMAGYFEASGCGGSGWTLEQAQDISATGCAPLGLESSSACPTEFDIVKLDGESLYFGDRSGGMCDEAKRTGVLQTVPVVKQ